ncbi:MAG: tetratricopeptide repeat protein [Phycisphaerales bacterium]
MQKHATLVIAGFIGATLAGAGLTGCGGPTKAGMEAREELRARHQGNLADLAAQQARQDFSVGNLDDALNACDVAIGYQPTNIEHHVLRGRILIELHKLDHAMRSFQQAITINENHGDAHYYAGLVQQRWSNDDAALVHYDAAFASDPMNVNYLMAKVETLITMRRLDEAEKLIFDRLPYFEHDASLRRAQGHLELMRQRYDEAAQCFEKAALLAPDEYVILEDLAYALFMDGQYAKADYYLERLMSEEKNADRRDLRQFKARCLVAMGRLIDARFIYLKLVNEQPSDRTAWHELGMVALQLGDMKRVQQVSARMISNWPHRHEGYLIRGLLAERADDQMAAQRDLRKALSLAPANPETRLVLSVALDRVGLEAEARQALAGVEGVGRDYATVPVSQD